MLVRQILPHDLYSGRTVFVTGGGSGINLGVARAFAALGAHVGICGRTAEKLEAAASILRSLNAHTHGRVLPVVADVRNYAALEAAMTQTRESLGPIDVLVCGAAGNFVCPAEKLSPNGFKTVVDIDLLGSFNAARAAFAQLAQTGGNALFISAGQALHPYAFQAHVSAAKAGMDQLMRNLALEWGPHGIRCNSIVPGPIADTEGMRRLSTPEVQAQLTRSIPLGRYGTADEIAQAAVFLASPLASYITGTVLRVDGGRSLGGSALFNQIAPTLVQARDE